MFSESDKYYCADYQVQLLLENYKIPEEKAREIVREMQKKFTILFQGFECINKKWPPKKFADAMNKIDKIANPKKHEAADNLMCKILEDIGYSEGVEVFREMDKWYA